MKIGGEDAVWSEELCRAAGSGQALGEGCEAKRAEHASYQVPLEVAQHDELQVEEVGEREEVLDE